MNKLDWNYSDSLKHSCNCEIKNECPLENKCNFDNIYQANISTKENDTNFQVNLVIPMYAFEKEI